MRRNDKKFRELVVYVCSQETVGATKLNKLLFQAEFEAYRQLGHPITGHPYVKRANGPAPKDLRPIRASLEADQSVRIEQVDIGAPNPEIRIVPLRDADIGAFEAEELSIIDQVVSRYRGISGQQMSDATHLTPGWRAAKLGAPIPYQTALISGEVSDADRKWAEQRAAALGLN